MEVNQHQQTDAHLPGLLPVQLNDTRLPIHPQNICVDLASAKQCRICLAQNQTDDNPLVSPCECMGSLKYVHRNCLRQWMQTKVTNSVDDYSSKNEVNCELCKKAVRVKIQFRRQCRKPSSIAQRIKQTISVFIVCIIGVAISLGVLIYSVSSLKSQIEQGFDTIETTQKAVILVSIPVELLLMLYFIASLLKYCITKRASLQFQDN